MVVGEILTIFGVGATILGVIGFDKTWFPARGPDHSCKIRVAVGHDMLPDSTSGGEFPDIRLFNELGEAIGQLYDYHEPGTGLNRPRVYIHEGEHYDVQVPQDNAQQPMYVLINGNNDAICVAYVSQVWPDETAHLWLGGWGKTCGAKWYYSNVYVGEAPKICTWIDADKTATDVVGIQMHFPEFTADSNGSYNEDVDYYCKNTPVLEFRKEWTKHVVYWLPDGLDGEMDEKKKRSSINGTQPESKPSPLRLSDKTLAAFSDHLTKTSFADQLATTLCESPTSSGPDLVSFEEGKFCDMKTRTVWPLCVHGNDKDCFDPETNDMRLFTRIGKREVPDLSMAKNYTRVHYNGLGA